MTIRDFIKHLRTKGQIELKPCPRCGAKNSHAIYEKTEEVTANGRTLYVRFFGIRCEDCGFSLDGYLNPYEAVTMWNAVEEVTK